MPGANEDAVAMLETELLLVGLPGLAGTNELGDAGKPAEGCRCIATGLSIVCIGMLVPVGVGVGVEWFDDCAALMLIGAGVVCRFVDKASGPVYFSPNSPGAKVTAEQNPSEEVISSVNPSLDLCQVSVALKSSDCIDVPCNVSEGSKV